MKSGKVLCALLAVFVLSGPAPAPAKTSINFMFPVPLQGKIAQEMGILTEEFNRAQNEVAVTAIFTGDYDQTKMKAAAAQKAGTPPAVVINSANYVSELALNGTILPLQNILSHQNMNADEYLKNEFWPALHANARFNGEVYGIPFHNSTPLLYYNKTMLDREGIQVPATWDEIVEAAKKLSNPEQDVWGIMLPSTNDDYGGWILASLVYANGGRVFNDEYPGEVYYNTPSYIGALTFWQDLVFKHKVMPEGVINAKTITASFFEQKVAMTFLSTGTLTFIRENVKDFEFGVAMMPEKERRAVLIGGASLVCYKGISEEQKKAAAQFIAFLTSPEISGRWSRITGYFAPRIKAYDLQDMKDFIKQNPNAKLGVDQLRYANSWYATYDTVMVRRAMENRLQKLVNDKSYAPELCAREAQAEADELMQPYARRTALRVP